MLHLRFLDSVNEPSAGKIPVVVDDSGRFRIEFLDQNTIGGGINPSEKGAANGVAELDFNARVPATQLPSYVDDVLEFADYASLPTSGENDKIYITVDDNKSYRWGGTAYVELQSGVVLGETSSTAYRGDRGKLAYDHSQLTDNNPHNTTKAMLGLDQVDNTSDINKPVSTAVQNALNNVLYFIEYGADFIAGEAFRIVNNAGTPNAAKLLESNFLKGTPLATSCSGTDGRQSVIININNSNDFLIGFDNNSLDVNTYNVNVTDNELSIVGIDSDNICGRDVIYVPAVDRYVMQHGRFGGSGISFNNYFTTFRYEHSTHDMILVNDQDVSSEVQSVAGTFFIANNGHIYYMTRKYYGDMSDAYHRIFELTVSTSGVSLVAIYDTSAYPKNNSSCKAAYCPINNKALITLGRDGYSERIKFFNVDDNTFSNDVIVTSNTNDTITRYQIDCCYAENENFFMCYRDMSNGNLKVFTVDSTDSKPVISNLTTIITSTTYCNVVNCGGGYVAMLYTSGSDLRIRLFLVDTNGSFNDISDNLVYAAWTDNYNVAYLAQNYQEHNNRINIGWYDSEHVAEAMSVTPDIATDYRDEAVGIILINGNSGETHEVATQSSVVSLYDNQTTNAVGYVQIDGTVSEVSTNYPMGKFISAEDFLIDLAKSSMDQNTLSIDQNTSAINQNIINIASNASQIKGLTTETVLDADSTKIVDSFVDTLGDGVSWKYIIKSDDGLNVRHGMISTCWIASSGTINLKDEITYGFHGDTSDITFTVDITSNEVRLVVNNASTSSFDWTIKLERTLI